MSQPIPVPTQPFARSPRPVPLFQKTAVLLVRGALGLGLLNTGLLGYRIQQTGIMPLAGGANRFGGAGTAWAPGFYSEWLPVVQIVLGLAVLLGFLTAVAASAAGLIQVVGLVLRTVAMLTLNIPWNHPRVFDLAHGGNQAEVLLAAAVAWLSASGVNPWSLDALMLGGERVEGGETLTRVGLSATGGGSPGRGTTA